MASARPHGCLLAAALLLCPPAGFTDEPSGLDGGIDQLCAAAEGCDKNYFALKADIEHWVPEDPAALEAAKKAFLAMDEAAAKAETDRLWELFNRHYGYAQSVSQHALKYVPYVKQLGTELQKNKMDCLCQGLDTGLYDEPKSCPLLSSLTDANWKALRAKMATLTTWSGLQGDLERLQLAFTIHEDSLNELEQKVAAASPKTPGDAAPFVERLVSLEGAVTKAHDLLVQDSAKVDEMGEPTQKAGGVTEVTGPGQLTSLFIDPLQERYAKIVRRLQFLHCRLGAGAPPGDSLDARSSDLSQQECVQSLQAAPDRAAGSLVLRTPLPSAGRLNTDPKAFSSIESEGLLSKIGISAPEGRDRWRKEDLDSKETDALLALRDKGQARTVGDPVGRAALVFQQTGGTCAVASQVEVAADAMHPPPTRDRLKAMENEYYKRAAGASWFSGYALDAGRRDSGGMPEQYIGDLLPMPVDKHISASPADLDRVVSSGKMVIVGVDAGLLWNDPNFSGGGHAVVVTGAELDKSGKVLGYYINDTGHVPPDGGRFVSAKQFQTAWYGDNHFFVEPL